MSGGIDRIRGRAFGGGGNTSPTESRDGAFASMLRPEQATSGTAEAAPSVKLSGAALLQANVADVFARTAQDREARRHGRALLQALAGLQRAALAGEDGQAQAALATLANTVRDPHEADDPVLRLILREIAVRAAVELARAEPAG